MLLLAGDGSHRKQLAAEVERRGLTNIRLLGQLPKNEMPRLWSITDASLVVLKKLDLFLSVIPSKLFESMSMKQPIILGVAGESADMMRESGAGMVIEPENAQELASSILRLADTPELCRELGENGARYVAANFDRRVLANQFERMLQDCVRRHVTN
jgi:glycosyltransferase involved in cell wall biosynthesis